MKQRRNAAALSPALAAVLAITLILAGQAPAAAPTPSHEGVYAVVASRKVMADRQWQAVCGALVRKHGAKLVTFGADVTEALPALAKLAPRYVCFVTPPDACGRDFVVAVHRLTRRLDDDPYTDCLWGILTGYDAADALRLANADGPLVLKKALSGTSSANLAPFDEWAKFDEGKAGRLTVRTADGKQSEPGCPDDSTKTLVDWFNNEKPDAFITSGHATQHDWQMGYSYKNGQLRCKDGQLFGLDTAGARHDVRSPNPKVFLPVGNCLIGDVPGPDCMVAALIRTGGVVQMFGYVVPTWYGKGGWGIQDVLLGQPGRWTLAEAFFINTQAMLMELRDRFPDAAAVDFAEYDMERRRNLIAELAARHNLKGGRDELGLLWDRDTVAFYGDPAFDARPAPRPLPWTQTAVEDAGRITVTVEATEAGTWPGHPVFVWLPRRVRPAPKVVEGADLAAVVTDDFVMIPLKGDFAAGDKKVLVLSSEPRP
jgi:zinc protease